MSRIIAGLAGGARIQVPAGSHTRPTTDRAKEALFSSLASWAGGSSLGAAEQLTGIAFLDLFAGSGAVGLEAASRGANRVVLVDNSPAAARAIKTNIASTELPNVSVKQSHARTFLEGSVSSFDIVFLDPPYDMPTHAIVELASLIVDRKWLVDNGVLVIERSAREPAPVVPQLADRWERTYGESVLYFAQAQDPEKDSDE